MGLFTKREWSGPAWAGATANDLIPLRGSSKKIAVTAESALRHSAVWAALRTRANIISTLPIDCYRRVNGWQVEVPKPPVLVSPGGDRVDITEWLYSSQFDLDRYGNSFGLITERDGNRLPRRIDLVPASEVSVQVRQGVLTRYLVAGKPYDPADVWHEKQYTVAGLHVGLSPVAYAAWSIGGYLGAQDFVLHWFDGGAVPSAHLKNTQKVVQDKQAQEIKRLFKQTVSAGDVFVTGADWDYNMISVPANQAQFIEEMKFGISDAARWFDLPGDLIDAEVSTGTITYANVTQRFLQLLIVHLAAPIIRRERALSTLLPAPRYVKFNTDALLRMDPLSRAQYMQTLTGSRLRAPDELREIDNLPPLTDAQIAQMLLLDPPKYPKPLSPGAEPDVPPADVPKPPGVSP